MCTTIADADADADAHANACAANACAANAHASNAHASNADADALRASTGESMCQTNQAATAQANANQAPRHTDSGSSAASTPHGPTHDATYASLPSNVYSTYPCLSAGVSQTVLQEGKTGKVRTAFQKEIIDFRNNAFQ